MTRTASARKPPVPAPQPALAPLPVRLRTAALSRTLPLPARQRSTARAGRAAALLLVRLRAITRAGCAAALLLPASVPAAAQTPVTVSELVVEIGRLDGPVHYTFGRPGAVRVLPGDRLLVADAQEAILHTYDMGGRHLFSFGRKGAGPGEFEWPQGVAVTTSHIHVFDSRLQRVSTFTLDGEHVDTRRPPDNAGRLSSPFRLRNGRWLAENPASLSSDHIQDVVRGDRRAGGSGISRLVVFDSVRVDTLTSFPSGHVFWFDAGAGVPFGGADVNFGAAGLWATSGDSTVAIVDGHRGRLTWFRAEPRGLVPTHNVDLALPRVPVGARDLAEVERQVRASSTGAAQVGRMGFIAPDYRGHFSRAVLDDRHDLWLQRAPAPGAAADAPPVFLVVRPDGSRREVQFPAGFSLSAVHNELLLGTTISEYDVPLVRVYRMPR